MSQLHIVPVSSEFVSAIKTFTDEEIGAGYYHKTEIENIVKLSAGDFPVSFLLVDNQKKIFGVRLSYPPGKWIRKFDPKRIFRDRWKTPHESVGYFKSLFVHRSQQQGGWGPKLSEYSMRSMLQLGATAIVTHCWKESPGGASQKYLERQGFETVGEHPFFWAEIDYDCTGCQQRPCKCSAIEMIRYL